MRKNIKLKRTLFLAALLFICSAVSGCTGYSGKHDGFYGNLDIKVSNFKLSSYAGAFYWDGTQSDLQISVPDKFNNVRVGSLGGYFGTGVPDPFRIQVQDPKFALWRAEKSGTVSEEQKAELLNNEKRLENYFNEYAYPDPGKYEVPVSLEELVFKLHIGRFVEKLHVDKYMSYVGWVQKDKSIVFYAPVVYIECSPDNRVFYAKDGKLYRRADNSLVDNFNYPGALAAAKEKYEEEKAAGKAAAAEAVPDESANKASAGNSEAQQTAAEARSAEKTASEQASGERVRAEAASEKAKEEHSAE